MRTAPMQDKACNEAVRFVVARTAAEAARLIEALPAVTHKGLATDLKECGEAYRFELSSESAYYLERRGAGLIMCSWRHVATYDEIADLLSLVATLDGPMTEEVARTLFTRATHKNAGSPQPSSPKLVSSDDLGATAT